MQPELKSHPIVENLVDVFGDWLKHRREMREVRDLDARTLGDIARDLRITSTDLDAFVRRGPHAADELPKLLKVLGIDETALARTETAVLRDMERVCVLCERKAQCSNDVEIGVAARDYEDYCPNAQTMKALVEGQAAGDAGARHGLGRRIFRGPDRRRRPASYGENAGVNSDPLDRLSDDNWISRPPRVRAMGS
jgi:hypothetical protein